jgi:hypothetical protein
VVDYFKQHTYDNATNFCTKCGASEDFLMETARVHEECPGGGNVIAISHMVNGPRLMDLADRMLKVAVNSAP